MTSQSDTDGGLDSASDKRVILRMADRAADLEVLRPLSVEFHQESHFRDIPYSHKKRDDLFMRAINEPDHWGLLIAEHDGQPVGFSFVTAGEYIVGYDALMTTVYSIYVRKSARGTFLGGRVALRLLTGIKRWSERRNVREVMIHVTSNIDIERTHRTLSRVGFKPVGMNYSLNLLTGKAGG